MGLLPGSRPREIGDHLPEMLKAARELAATGFQFVVPPGPNLNTAQRDEVKRLAEFTAPGWISGSWRIPAPHSCNVRASVWPAARPRWKRR